MDYYTDEIRVEDLAVELGFDATVAPYDEANLGRLKVRNTRVEETQDYPTVSSGSNS